MDTLDKPTGDLNRTAIKQKAIQQKSRTIELKMIDVLSFFN